MSSSRKPLSSIALNRVLKGKGKPGKRCGKSQREPSRTALANGEASRTSPELGSQSTPRDSIYQQPYTPLGPRIEHVGQSILPFNSSEASDLKVFELFWDREIVNVLVEGTNAYAEAKGAGKEIPGGGTRRPWRKVTDAEIRVFFALLIYMGAKRGCGSTSFWKDKGENRVFFRVMGLKRFSQIKRYLHISDPALQLSRSEWFQSWSQ